MSSESALASAIRAGLAERADPSRAPAMQAYMKSAMPYRGVTSVPLRALCRDVFAAHTLPDFDSWRNAIVTLWREATHREERYAAIELALLGHYKAFRTIDALPMYEEIVVSGAWWDYVDSVASDLVGPLLRAHPAEMNSILLGWSTDGNMWKRRSAIISQLRFRADTDLDLLYRAIEPNIADKEFFIRKAIGWALRQYAWTNPTEIQRYVAAHPELSGLSRREALKNVGAGGQLSPIAT